MRVFAGLFWTKWAVLDKVGRGHRHLEVVALLADPIGLTRHAERAAARKEGAFLRSGLGMRATR